MSVFNEWINKRETGINRELFEKYFKFQRPSDMLKAVYNTNDRKKNNKLVNVINSRLRDFKEETEDMSEEEKETKSVNEIVDVVENILGINKQNQEEEGLKILTPN